MKTNILKSTISRLKEQIKGEFAKNLFTLGTGTIIAQLIPVLASPFLTRIYTPSQFGLFANYSAIMALLLVFFSGKFELAIILPKTHKEAINIVSLCFIVIFISTIFFSIVIIFSGNTIAKLLHNKELVQWLWLVPFGALFASTYMVMNEWYIRKNNFLGLSKNKIANTFGITVSSLVLGLIRVNLGLIVGQIIGQIFSSLSAFFNVLKYDKQYFKFISVRKIKYFAKKHINFSKFFISGQLISTLSGQAPIFILTSVFGITATGLFAFTDRIMGVPMSFIGNAFRDVFKQRAAIDYKNDGNCLRIYKKVTISLIKVSILPFIIIFISAPSLFSFIFGNDWFQAGIYARILSVMYFMSFISMPLGWIFIIVEKPELDLLWQILNFFLTIIPLIIGVWSNSTMFTIVLYGAGKSVSYFIYMLMTYNLAKGKINLLS